MHASASITIGYMDIATCSATKYCTWKIFGGGNVWQTMQVEAIGEEKFGE